MSERKGKPDRRRVRRSPPFSKSAQKRRAKLTARSANAPTRAADRMPLDLAPVTNAAWDHRDDPVA